MKINRTITLLLLSIILFSGSCISMKKLTYLNYSGKPVNNIISASNINLSVTPADYRVLPYDNLFIRVITPDPQWSELFNTTSVGAGGAMTEESASLVGYPVDSDGNIEIPFVGKVQVVSKSLSEIKFKLDSVFKNYVSEAAITVRLVNNYISVLGEVNVPGRYRLTKNSMNVFEALSLAGDMSPYSNRKRLQLIRPTANGQVVKEFSLTDRNILSSELYFVMPNDIIYALPMKGKSFQINSPVWTLLLTTVTSALGVIAFFRTF